MTKKIFRIYDNNQISILNEYSAIYKKNVRWSQSASDCPSREFALPSLHAAHVNAIEPSEIDMFAK